MARRVALRLAVLALASTGAAFVACLPGDGPGLLDPVEGGSPNLELGDPDAQRRDVDLGDPFGIDGLFPSHGPFTGGTRANLSGRGFSPKLRVWFGDVELDASRIFASDPTRAAVMTPAGNPGPVDVRIRDDVTAKERVLKQGFVYDAFVVAPDSGATSGGTRISITGSGTTWVTGASVTVGGKPCGDVVVDAPTHILCSTPGGTPGAKDVVVRSPGAADIQVRDAFTYSDSPDGYRGGLSGGALAGRIRVLAMSAATGQPIGGAKVIVGGVYATAFKKDTAPTGVAEITDASLAGAVTVTVAAKCQQPITFVDVPVDTVTAYLAPELDPACAEGDPPSTGGNGGRYGGEIKGQLVFGGGLEFRRGPWGGVPGPSRPTERQAAYVFEASTSPLAGFRLPSAAEAITPEAPGSVGYEYAIVTYPGNQTIYAIAGLEDRSFDPPRFTPYVMGVVRGIGVPPATRVEGVDIPMKTLVDHQVTLAPSPPGPGPRGPDRFLSQVAVTLGQSAYAILPNGTRVTPLPLLGPISFVGVPSLDESLAGESYIVGGAAVSGPSLGIPASVVSRIRTSQANDPIAIGGYLPVPQLGQPGAGVWSGSRVDFVAPPPVTADLTLVQVTSGLVTWTLVAPGAKTSFDVPDLSLVPGPRVGLSRGAITTTVSLARIEQFNYGKLRYGQLQVGAWNAHAFDSLSGAY